MVWVEKQATSCDDTDNCNEMIAFYMFSVVILLIGVLISDWSKLSIV